MKERIESVAKQLQVKAENYAAISKNPKELIGRVLQIGTAAVLKKNFTPQQAAEVAAMMIAVLAMLEESSGDTGQ